MKRQEPKSPRCLGLQTVLILCFLCVFAAGWGQRNAIFSIHPSYGLSFYGLRDSISGVTILQPIYNQLQYVDRAATFLVGYSGKGKDSRTELFDRRGNRIYGIQMGGITTQQSPAYSFVVHDSIAKTYALIDTTGSLLLRFEKRKIFGEGQLVFEGEDSLLLVRNAQGDSFSPCRVTSLGHYGDWIHFDCRYMDQYFDSLGRILMWFEKNASLSLSEEDRKLVQAWKFFDDAGNRLLGPYNSIGRQDTNAQVFPVAKLGKWGWNNRNGDVVVPPKYAYIEGFNAKGCARIAMELDGFYRTNPKNQGVIDSFGAVIVPPIFPSIDMGEELILAKDGYDAYLIDYHGSIVRKYSDRPVKLIPESGIFVVYERWNSRERKMEAPAGILGPVGDTLLPFCYRTVRHLKDSLAVVSPRRHKVFAINLYTQQRQGRLHYKYWSSPEFSYAGGHMKVSKGLWRDGLVNSDWQEIIPPRYKEIDADHNYFRVVTVMNRYGLYSTSGKLILPAKYRLLHVNNDSTLDGRLHKRKYTFDATGHLLRVESLGPELKVQRAKQRAYNRRRRRHK